MTFIEAAPPAHLASIVHKFVHVKSDGTLSQDYRFHALPDACPYIVFDQLDPAVTGISRLAHASEEFNLGRTFHFVNIRLLPGTWQLQQHPIATGQITRPYQGRLSLLECNRSLLGRTFDQQQDILSALVESLMDEKILAVNTVMHRILSKIDLVNSVADMAAVVGVSPRHLHRLLKPSTGFAPHDLLKIIRLQKSLDGDAAGCYADQSHFISSFRKATGYTPRHYNRKFDV